MKVDSALCYYNLIHMFNMQLMEAPLYNILGTLHDIFSPRFGTEIENTLLGITNILE